MALSNVVKRSVLCSLSLSSLNKTANDGRYDPCTNVVGIHTAAFNVSSKGSKCNAFEIYEGD